MCSASLAIEVVLESRIRDLAPLFAGRSPEERAQEAVACRLVDKHVDPLRGELFFPAPALLSPGVARVLVGGSGRNGCSEAWPLPVPGPLCP